MFMRECVSRSSPGRSVISIAFVVAVTLTLLGSAVLSQEIKDEKPKKPRFEKTDLTLTDNKSGLIWALNANLTERQLSWPRLYVGIDNIVNEGRYAGFRDWRVPAKEELLTLVELARSQGYDGKSPGRSIREGLASIGFQNIQDDSYWSSTEYHYFSADAWVVDMTVGAASLAEKTLYFNLWPVRSAN